MNSEIPETQLYDLGFERVSAKLFKKEMKDGSVLFRDYRETQPLTYAYHRGKRINHRKFSETHALPKIEAMMESLKRKDQSLVSFS